MTGPDANLLRLFAILLACPTREERISDKLLFETWNGFKQIDPEHGDEITPALITGLILFDEESFAALLNEAEHAQLAGLGRKAMQRHQQLTHPPNPLGNVLAASLKEST